MVIIELDRERFFRVQEFSDPDIFLRRSQIQFEYRINSFAKVSRVITGLSSRMRLKETQSQRLFLLFLISWGFRDAEKF